MGIFGNLFRRKKRIPDFGEYIAEHLPKFILVNRLLELETEIVLDHPKLASRDVYLLLFEKYFDKHPLMDDKAKDELSLTEIRSQEWLNILFVTEEIHRIESCIPKEKYDKSHERLSFFKIFEYKGYDFLVMEKDSAARSVWQFLNGKNK